MCSCECRHLMRFIAAACDEFDPVLPEPNEYLDKGRSSHTLMYEVGEVGQWYHREMYLLYCPETGLPLESFSKKFRYLYTQEEARRLFCELRSCQCCARHLAARPDYPFDHLYVMGANRRQNTRDLAA